LLIGPELFTQMLCSAKIVGQAGQPTALETTFGWVLIGKVSGIVNN